jgi:predicted O-methyltransferase YrrM
MKTNPAITIESPAAWLHPVQAGPTTVLEVARDPATLDAVAATLARLVPDAYIDQVRAYYALGRERFGAHWYYVDQLTALHACATLLRPRRYLEIGVFRGRSLAVVAAAAPECELFAFDLWIPGYAGLENAGPELVREQLRRVGHRGPCHVESGDSHLSVPRFLAEHPELRFDLVTVDGDHTEEGARADLETVLPLVAVGGALVFDDIRHPRHPWLERVFEEVLGAAPAFVGAKFTEVGHGVAIALRRADDDPELAQLRGGGSERMAALARTLGELRAKRDERIEVLENEMARRLELIERQGAELGRIPGLEAELADLRRHVEFAEADRAKRLEVILRQGDELGRIPGLEAELADLRRHVEFAEADRAKRLEVILRQGTELGVLRAEVADRLWQARAHVQRLGRGTSRKLAPALALLDEALDHLTPSPAAPAEPQTPAAHEAAPDTPPAAVSADATNAPPAGVVASDPTAA